MSGRQCVVHREDLGLGDAWENVIHGGCSDANTVYIMLSRSSIKNGKLEELANVTEYNVLTFRLINEVTAVKRHPV